MSEWSVRVEGPGDRTDRTLAELAEHLDRWHGVAGSSAERISARFTVAADTPEDAAAEARRIVADWVATPDTVEVTTLERLAVWNEEPEPELVGLAEVAALLNVARQRVSELDRSGRLPAPRARLASGPAWERRSINRWAADWARKPDRPRRAV